FMSLEGACDGGSTRSESPLKSEPSLDTIIVLLGRSGAIAMKSRGLLLTAILTFAVGAAWTVHLSRSGQSCPRPSAASVTMLFDPCQAYDEARATISPVPASDVDGLGLPSAPV